MRRRERERRRRRKLTRYHFFPYLATTLASLDFQFSYHLQRVAESVRTTDHQPNSSAIISQASDEEEKQKGKRTMNTKNINRFNFKSNSFDLSNNPVQSARSVCSREHVFVHKESPDEIFVLPSGSNSRYLKDENSVVF